MHGMWSLRRVSCIGIAVAALSQGVVLAAPRHRAVRVGISVDGSAPAAVSRHEAAMIAEANAIWRRYDVIVTLLGNGDAPEIAACDVQLTLTFAPSGQAAPASQPIGPRLGSIWFHDAISPGQSVTIDSEMVEAKVREGVAGGKPLNQWPPALADAMVGRALGRVLAHEIGHFLLASSAHTSSGLMRPAFDGRVLGGWDRNPFRLQPIALGRLHARLARLATIERPVVAASGQDR